MRKEGGGGGGGGGGIRKRNLHVVITGYWALFNRSHTVDFVLLMALRKRHIVLYFSVSNDFLRLLFLATLKPFSLLYCSNQLAAIEYPRMLILEKGNDFMQQFLLHLGSASGVSPCQKRSTSCASVICSRTP